MGIVHAVVSFSLFVRLHPPVPARAWLELLPRLPPVTAVAPLHRTAPLCLRSAASRQHRADYSEHKSSSDRWVVKKSSSGESEQSIVFDIRSLDRILVSAQAPIVFNPPFPYHINEAWAAIAHELYVQIFTFEKYLHFISCFSPSDRFQTSDSVPWPMKYRLQHYRGADARNWSGGTQICEPADVAR